MFRDAYPLAWEYHRNTCRWSHNVHAVSTEGSSVAPFKEYHGVKTVALPEAQYPTMGLADAIAARLSCRRYSGEAIACQDLATLLKTGYGVRDRILLDGQQEFLERAVPSGGGLYPLELYVLAQNITEVESGAYHYSPLSHTLDLIHAGRLPGRLLSELFLGQPYLMECAAVVIIAGLVERSLWKYEDRGYRYILLEAGHVAQNLNLMAVALGLGSLNLGGFFDHSLARILQIDPDVELPLYGVALGVPSEDERVVLRSPLGADSTL